MAFAKISSCWVLMQLQGPKLTFWYGRQLAIKYKFLVARGQIVVAKNSPSLFFQ